MTVSLAYVAHGDTQQIAVAIPDGETFAGYPGPTTMVVLDLDADWPLSTAVKALIADGATIAAAPQPPTPVPPDCKSLPFWRFGLQRWFRTDPTTKAQISRFVDADAAIKALETAINPDGSPNLMAQVQGQFAREQFEYANTVERGQLLQLAPAFGFTPVDCDESLWRANQIALGDLTGTWPLTSSAGGAAAAA